MGRVGRGLGLRRFLSTGYPLSPKGKQGFSTTEVDLVLSSMGTVDDYFKSSGERSSQTGQSCGPAAVTRRDSGGTMKSFVLLAFGSLGTHCTVELVLSARSGVKP